LQLITTTTEKRGNVTYHIHDTRGIGDDKVDLNEMKDAVKQVYRNNDCLVIVCIKYDERLVDYNSKLPLEVCNELSDDVWSKAIIAITNSDKLSPKVLSLQPTDRNAKISKAKKEWEEQIHETLSKLKKGSLGEIQNVKICFTGYTGIFCQVEEHWEDKLFKAIIEIAPNFKGAANYIILQCLFEGHGATSCTCSSNLSVNRLVDPSTNPPHHTIPVFKILKEVAESGEYIGNKIGSHAGTAAFIAASGEWKTASGAERFGRSVGSSFGSFLLTGAAGLLIWLYIQKNFDI
jgi:predicted GTPase